MTAVRVGNIYEAYSGPETGGFGLVPQSAVPVLDNSSTLPSELGPQSIDEPLPFEPTDIPAPSKGAIKVTTLPEFSASPLSASTIAPKGGTPYQPSMPVDQAHEMYRRMMQEQPSLVPQNSVAENLWRSGAKSFSNNFLSTPSIVQDVVPGARVLSYPGRKLLEAAGVPAEYTTVPRVDVDQIGAATRAATSDLTYDEARQNVRRNEAQREAARPTSTEIGSVIGDVATLALGRQPALPWLRGREYVTEKAIKKGHPVSSKEPFGDPFGGRSPEQWRAAINQSPGFNTLKKVLRRTGEAGVEGAALALMKGNDPVESAGFTAGAQFAAGGASQALLFKYMQFPRFGRLANFAVNQAILAPAFYALDVVAPGEAKDYEAQRSATQKLLWGYALGGTLGIFSNRARTGMFSANTPRITDALASAPRNAMQSVMIDYLNSDSAKRLDIKTKVETVYNNLDKLSEGQLRDLAAAFEAGNKERYYKELDKALKGLPVQ